MKQMQLRAMAKINLGLDVLRKREDGYHEVRMVMQTIRLFDRLDLTKIQQKEIQVTTNLHFLPVNENNLVYRAAQLMQETYSLSGGLRIDLTKRIPVAAGLAGGSADAAAVLYGINRMYRLGLSLQNLQKLGVSLGADVPYCLMRGTALAEGIGEKLSPLPPCPSCYVVIAKPWISVSTKFVYENLHANELKEHPNIDGLMEAIRNGDCRAMAERMGNVLETVTVEAYPVIAQLKLFLMERGAMGALMSGSGPTVFGLFETNEQAQAAAVALRQSHLAQMVYATRMYPMEDALETNRSDGR